MLKRKAVAQNQQAIIGRHGKIVSQSQSGQICQL
jgi:hypothetical protein